jgi:hypothetical protein
MHNGAYAFALVQMCSAENDHPAAGRRFSAQSHKCRTEISHRPSVVALCGETQHRSQHQAEQALKAAHRCRSSGPKECGSKSSNR